MSTAIQEVYVRGPLHPDLFDGETPIVKRLPLEQAVRCWDVRVLVSASHRVEVLAHDEEQAAWLAESEVEASVDLFDAEIEADTVRPIERKPSQQELQEWAQRVGEVSP